MNGGNLYQFVASNTPTYIDPTGEDFVTALGDLIGSAVAAARSVGAPTQLPPAPAILPQPINLPYPRLIILGPPIPQPLPLVPIPIPPDLQDQLDNDFNRVPFTPPPPDWTWDILNKPTPILDKYPLNQTTPRKQTISIWGFHPIFGSDPDDRFLFGVGND